MRAAFAYTTARILLFAAATGLFYLAGARGLLLLGLALLVSGAASYVLLSRQRDAMSGALVNRFRTLRARIDEGARAEDDQQAAASGGGLVAGQPPTGDEQPQHGVDGLLP